MIDRCHWDDTQECDGEFMCDMCEHQPPPEDKVNGRAEPVRITWETGYMNDGLWPRCPSCGEMPYGLECCIWCGQRFIQDDPVLQEYDKPPEEERLDCFMCGGKNTMVGTRAKSNGHFHGHCEACGCRVME